MLAVGVDIGGMSIKVGIVDENGKIKDKLSFKTVRKPKDDITNLIKFIKEILQKNHLDINDIKGIGVGCPGTINNDTGIVEYLPNLNWFDIPFSECLKKELDTKIVIANDANVAVLGEVVFGCAKDYSNVVLITIGTGVGGGLVIDKKLYIGNEGKGTELGHVTLKQGGLKCSCGRKGCVEAYLSATALIDQTKKAMLKHKESLLWKLAENDLNNITGKSCWTAEEMGDKTAKKVCENYINMFADTIMSYCNIFRPDAIIIGGGISARGKEFTDRLKNVCRKHEYGYHYAPETPIMCASLGNDAGIIGSASLLYSE